MSKLQLILEYLTDDITLLAEVIVIKCLWFVEALEAV